MVQETVKQVEPDGLKAAKNGKNKKATEPKMVEELTFHEEMPTNEIK